MAGYRTAGARATANRTPVNLSKLADAHERVAARYRQRATESSAIWGASHPRTLGALELARAAQESADALRAVSA